MYVGCQFRRRNVPLGLLSIFEWLYKNREYIGIFLAFRYAAVVNIIVNAW